MAADEVLRVVLPLITMSAAAISITAMAATIRNGRNNRTAYQHAKADGYRISKPDASTCGGDRDGNAT